MCVCFVFCFFNLKSEKHVPHAQSQLQLGYKNGLDMLHIKVSRIVVGGFIIIIFLIIAIVFKQQQNNNTIFTIHKQN